MPIFSLLQIHGKATDLVTLSIGICSLIPQSYLCDRDLIARADEHLYQAKAEGRNRIVAELIVLNSSPSIGSEKQNPGKHVEAQ